MALDEKTAKENRELVAAMVRYCNTFVRKLRDASEADNFNAMGHLFCDLRDMAIKSALLCLNEELWRRGLTMEQGIAMSQSGINPTAGPVKADGNSN